MTFASRPTFAVTVQAADAIDLAEVSEDLIERLAGGAHGDGGEFVQWLVDRSKLERARRRLGEPRNQALELPTLWDLAEIEKSKQWLKGAIIAAPCAVDAALAVEVVGMFVPLVAYLMDEAEINSQTPGRANC
jgi:hypothetical protein